MDGSITVVKTGINITTSGTSARGIIPTAQSGEVPRHIRVSATAAAYVKLGVAAQAISAAINAAGSSYAPADTITLTGGTSTTATVLTVASTKLVSASVNAAGTGYAPNDTITLSGGTATTPAVLTVTHTKVVSATVAAGGSGGTNGAQTVTGTTGTGTKFQASVTVSGGAITAVNSISLAGDYTVNPTNIAAEPVTGASLTGAQLNVVMGVLTTSITTAGVYTANAASFTQASTSGTGTGATFNTTSFGVNAATVTTAGSYSVVPANPVAQGSTSGSGSSATFNMTWSNTGIAAVAGDMMVQPGDAVVVHVPSGVTDIAALQVSGAGTVQVSPLENL
jgi:hypothetical protein